MRRGLVPAAVMLLGALAGGAPPLAALDLAGALRDVAASNATLAAKRAMTDAARARVAPSGAWPSPMVELGVANVPTNGRLDMDPMTMRMVGVVQRVPVFGGNRLARSAARQGVLSQAAMLRMTGYELMGAAWEAYADSYYAVELARLAERHEGVMSRLVASAEARYRAATGRLDDVLRAQAEQARIYADVAAFGAEERGARARLDALRGLSPGAPAEPLAPLPESPVPPETGAWLAAVGAEHPRLRELESRATGYRLSARASRRMVWPDLELRGSYGRRGTLEDGTALDDMFSASVGMMLPIFARQRELSEAREMDAMARAGDAERRAAQLELEQEVSATHAAALAAQRTVGLLADTVLVVQKRSAEASWSAYAAGSTDLWRALEASHTLYNEEAALLRARQQLARAQARMLSLTGRGDLLGVVVPAILE